MGAASQKIAAIDIRRAKRRTPERPGKAHEPRSPGPRFTRSPPRQKCLQPKKQTIAQLCGESLNDGFAHFDLTFSSAQWLNWTNLAADLVHQDLPTLDSVVACHFGQELHADSAVYWLAGEFP
jgi:hypothetical protein